MEMVNNETLQSFQETTIILVLGVNLHLYDFLTCSHELKDHRESIWPRNRRMINANGVQTLT